MCSPEDIEYCNELTIAHCCQLAREILREHDIQFDKTQPGGGITKLCIYEPHLHKKAIMFTSFIFSIVISEALDIEFMWSSDSDTIVLPDSLPKTIATVAGDENAGGASSGLIVHNEHETLWTKLASAVYWCELYLTRSAVASSGTSECQSGPSAVFRVSALPGILYCWYTQKVMGRRMVSVFPLDLYFYIVALTLLNTDRERGPPFDNQPSTPRVDCQLCIRRLGCNGYANHSEPMASSAGKL
jgi:hyaluronan synthase